MPCQHLQLAYSYHDVAMGCNIGEHILIADAGVHTTPVAEDEHRKFLFLHLTRGKHAQAAHAHSGIEVHRTIDHKVGQRLLTYGNGFVRPAAAKVGHFHLFETDRWVVVFEVAGIESVHCRTSEFQLFVESHAMVAMHLDIIDLCASPLHLHHPVFSQVRSDGRVFATLQHKERSRVLADIPDRPPFGVLRPRDVGITYLCWRRSTSSTCHRAVVLTPWILSVVERLAVGCHTRHQREVSSSRMAIGADALWVDTQLLGIGFHPSNGAAHILDAGRQRRLLNQAVVHVADHVAFHGIVDHQCAIDHIILRSRTPSATMNNEDGWAASLRSE